MFALVLYIRDEVNVLGLKSYFIGLGLGSNVVINNKKPHT